MGYESLHQLVRRTEQIRRGKTAYLAPQCASGPAAFFSPEMSKGDRFEFILSGELEESDVGVFVLTPENLLSPWLHFEAGAIAKRSGKSAVMTYLISLSVLSENSAAHNPLWEFDL